MSHIGCPHCGKNTVWGTPVERGKWWVGPVSVIYDTQQIAMPRYLVRTLYALAWANGAPITHRDLPNITPQTLAGHVGAIRRLFGDRNPVRAVPGRGYAWDMRA